MSTKKWLMVVAAAAAGTALLSGSLPIAALLPYAFLLVCPIAMWFMMKGMGGMDHAQAADKAAAPVGTHAAAPRPVNGEDHHAELPVDPSTDAQYRH